VILTGMHVNVDVWIVVPSHNPDITGFRWLTPKALAWAHNYKHLTEEEAMSTIWVASTDAVPIIRDMDTAGLDALIDNVTGESNA
jgi:hypothetical protein